MSLVRLTAVCLAAGLLHLGVAWPVRGQETSAGAEASAVKAPPLPGGRSPVDAFRELLALDAEGREKLLANYAPENREPILAKIREYQILPPELRELRLRVTELRWYLLPVLRTPATNRTAQLKLIPEPQRELVAERIMEWDLLPPPLRDEMLEYETLLHHFVGRNRTLQPQPVLDDIPDKDRPGLDRQRVRWEALPTQQREQIYSRFQRFFELSDREKQKALETLPHPERIRAERTVEEVEKWPEPLREQYAAAFHHFANMSSEEREQFRRNAQRWHQMSPAEQQAWRDLVRSLSQLPPLPPGMNPKSATIVPPPPPVPRSQPPALPATNGD